VKNINNKHYWEQTIDSPKHRAWTGYAFEQVCAMHIEQIKHGLGISAVYTQSGTWRSKKAEKNAQIDLILDRNDQIVNLCETKFSINKFTIDKKYAENLRNKVSAARAEINTKKAIHIVMITTYGITENAYAMQLVSNNITLEYLFS
jgi:uncharacterized protein